MQQFDLVTVKDHQNWYLLIYANTTVKVTLKGHFQNLDRKLGRNTAKCTNYGYFWSLPPEPPAAAAAAAAAAAMAEGARSDKPPPGGGGGLGLGLCRLIARRARAVDPFSKQGHQFILNHFVKRIETSFRTTSLIKWKLVSNWSPSSKRTRIKSIICCQNSKQKYTKLYFAPK